MYIADTHAIVWFLTGDRRLGTDARKVLESADSGQEAVGIPSIVLLELLHICEKKRYELEFGEVLEKISGSLNYPVLPLNVSIVKECVRLKELRDLHDRVLVASARLLDATLITKDEGIRESGLVETVW